MRRWGIDKYYYWFLLRSFEYAYNSSWASFKVWKSQVLRESSRNFQDLNFTRCGTNMAKRSSVVFFPRMRRAIAKILWTFINNIDIWYVVISFNLTFSLVNDLTKTFRYSVTTDRRYLCDKSFQYLPRPFFKELKLRCWIAHTLTSISYQISDSRGFRSGEKAGHSPLEINADRDVLHQPCTDFAVCDKAPSGWEIHIMTYTEVKIGLRFRSLL